MNLRDQSSQYDDTMTKKRIEAANASFMSNVYAWMMAGLIISGLVSYEIAHTPALLHTIFSNSFIWIGAFILQFAAVIGLSAFINKMSVSLTMATYLAYAVLSGVTLSIIFVTFTAASIYQAFFITAFAFTGLSLFGYLTKRDLGPIGSFCMIGLFGIIGLMLLTLFIPTLRTYSVEMAINVMGIMIFAGLTAYDTQKIKNFNLVSGPTEVAKKQAVYGALVLYLDFINLFLNILNVMNRKP